MFSAAATQVIRDVMLAGRQAAEGRQRCVERLRNSVIMGDGVMASIEWTMTSTSTELPAVMSDVQLSRVVDVDLMTSLSSAKIINWCRTVRPIYPLRTNTSCTEWTGSRDSLLVAVTTAVWGSSDAQLVDMVRRLVYVALTQTPARLRERCKADFIDESDLAADITRDTGTGQWRRVCSVFGEHVDQCAAVKPIHVFVLSNVIRRPLVVVGETACAGVYLPLAHAPSRCSRSPLTVLHVDDQFVPLVPRAGDSTTEPGVPLCRADSNEQLVVRCLLVDESPERALSTYLHVIQLTHTSATCVRLLPVAKYDVVAPDVNVLDEFLSADATQPDPLPPQATRVGGSYSAVLEQLTAPSARPLDADQLEYRPCQTAGCQFYALQQHHWKCSRCYVNESTGSQSASSAAGHVLQLVEEHEPPRWNGELMQRGVTSSQAVTAVICSVPGCSEPICADSETYCLQHATRPHSPTCANAGCSRPAGDKYQGLCTNCYVKAASSPRDVIGRRVAVTTETPSCIMDFCSNVGCVDCKGLCRQCFSALCQTRLNSAAFDPPTAASANNHGGSERASVKCMMEGCRTMIPTGSDVCETCRRKQLEAYEDVMRGHH